MCLFHITLKPGLLLGAFDVLALLLAAVGSGRGHKV